MHNYYWPTFIFKVLAADRVYLYMIIYGNDVVLNVALCVEKHLKILHFYHNFFTKYYQACNLRV